MDPIDSGIWPEKLQPDRILHEEKTVRLMIELNVWKVNYVALERIKISQYF